MQVLFVAAIVSALCDIIDVMASFVCCRWYCSQSELDLDLENPHRWEKLVALDFAMCCNALPET
jgi:hypothetical protein